jgi:hypothetical protein
MFCESFVLSPARRGVLDVTACEVSRMERETGCDSPLVTL